MTDEQKKYKDNCKQYAKNMTDEKRQKIKIIKNNIEKI